MTAKSHDKLSAQSAYRFTNLRGGEVEMRWPWVMGIVNITPDSFYRQSRVADSMNLQAIVSQMIGDGVDVIDVGAYSTRPGAATVCVEDEIERLANALRILMPYALERNVYVSVDTFRSQVASYVVNDFGVDIINDVSGGTLDPDMFATMARLKVPYVLTHMRGTPQTMSELTRYPRGVVIEVLEWMRQGVERLRDMGVQDVIADPGFGFAKTMEQNYELLAELEQFQSLHVPVMVGVSRKSMIQKLLGCTADEALNGTTVLNVMALMKGAAIVRVHDVREAAEAVRIYNQVVSKTTMKS